MSFSVIIVGKWPNTDFREREFGPPTLPFVNVFQYGPPCSRQEGILSRLRSHTLRSFLGEYLRTLRGQLTGGQSRYSSLGSGPGIHVFPVTPSHEAEEENHKTNHLRSHHFLMASGSSLGVIWHAITGIFSLAVRSNRVDAV